MKRSSGNGRRPAGRRPLFLLAATVLSLAACDRSATRSQPPAAGVVDSIFPVVEQIRRFKTSLPEHLQRDTTIGGATSRDELVAAFVRALASHDTTQLRMLTINAGEFINVFYGESRYARPPYQLDPALVWFLTQQNSAKGIGRALERFGGHDAGAYRYACHAEPELAGANRLWHRCIVEWSLDPVRIGLFGTIIERAGRFKFVSFANDL